MARQGRAAERRTAGISIDKRLLTFLSSSFYLQQDVVSAGIVEFAKLTPVERAERIEKLREWEENPKASVRDVAKT